VWSRWSHISENSSRKITLLLLICALPFPTIAENDTGISVKNKVETLLIADDIISANRLLNSNSSLEPEYFIEVLNANLIKAKAGNKYEALAYTYLSIGNFWFMRSNNVKAYENFYQAEKISRQKKFDWITALALMNRSHLEPDREVKIAILREAIGMFQKLKDQVNLAKAHLNLGQAFSDYNLTDSLRNVTNAARITLENGPLNKVVYRDSAFKHYRIAGMLNDSLSHPEIVASVNVHLAEWYKFEGKFTQAEDYFNTAFAFFGQANQSKGQIYCLLQLVDIAMVNGNYSTAREKLDSAADWAERMGFSDYLAKVYNKYTSLYEKTGDPEKALAYNRQYTQILGQLNKSISQDRIHALNLEYALEEQKNLIASLNQKKQTNRLLLILISSAAILALITSYLLVQNKRRKIQLINLQVTETKRLNELQKELLEADLERQHLEKELLEEKVKVKTERIIMIANQMNKLDTFLQSIGQEVKLLTDNNNRNDLSKTIADLKLSLSQSMHEQTNLRELQALSTETNQDFFFHISQKYSGVTRDDVKLLSFLVMNMSSKEISRHFNISQESINKKRYRLRQKLNIAAGKSFAEFYKETLETL
jgi:hypothetical protein